MSVRYVWGRYYKKTTWVVSKTAQSDMMTVFYGDPGIGPSGQVFFNIATNKAPTVDPNTGQIIVESKRIDTIGDNTGDAASGWWPMLPTHNDKDEMPTPTSWVESPNGNGYWHCKWWNSNGPDGGYHTLFLSTLQSAWMGSKPEDRLMTYNVCTPSRTGTAIGNRYGSVSGSTSSAYPSNGISGSYWYVYSGSDSIDPISISTVVDRWLYIGQQLTITASPSTSIQYGGTISYQYQVQLNGGAWTNIGSKTTATSINYTVPDGTTSITFRVQASDNMGFTSADWIQSETYAVSKYVPGIAQKLHRKNASGEYDLVHMETDTQIVLMNSGSTLEDELLAILAEIERRGG